MLHEPVQTRFEVHDGIGLELAPAIRPRDWFGRPQGAMMGTDLWEWLLGQHGGTEARMGKEGTEGGPTESKRRGKKTGRKT